MQTDNSPKKISYLKFDLSSLAGKTLISAKLRVKVATDTSSGTQRVKGVTNTSWSESTITYANRPSLGSSLGTFSAGSSNTWKEVTVTSYVSSRMGSPVSLAIDTSSDNSADYYTKETDDKPTLVLTYW